MSNMGSSSLHSKAALHKATAHSCVGEHKRFVSMTLADILFRILVRTALVPWPKLTMRSTEMRLFRCWSSSRLIRSSVLSMYDLRDCGVADSS